MRKIRKTYSEEEKLYYLHSYYESGMSKTSFCKKHGLCGKALLNTWIKMWSEKEKPLSLPPDQETTDMANRSKEDYEEENAQLKKRLKELEKALEFSKLQTEARDMLIDRAEEIFKISIRKKSGAK